MAKKKKKEEEYNIKLDIDAEVRTEKDFKVRVGWLCPKCKVICSPYVQKCPDCRIKTITWIKED